MTNTLSDGTTTLPIHLIMGWTGTREARTVTHDILGDPDGYVSLRPSGPELIPLSLLVDDETQALATLSMLGSGLLLTLTTDEIGTISRQLVVVGDATRTLDDQTLTRWVVTADVRTVVV